MAAAHLGRRGRKHDRPGSHERGRPIAEADDEDFGDNVLIIDPAEAVAPIAAAATKKQTTEDTESTEGKRKG